MNAFFHFEEEEKIFVDNTHRFKTKQPDDVKWMAKYRWAMEYYIQHGDLYVPPKYETEDGIKLGGWIRTQRSCKKNNDLSQERINMLEKIGMIWESKPGAKRQ